MLLSTGVTRGERLGEIMDLPVTFRARVARPFPLAALALTAALAAACAVPGEPAREATGPAGQPQPPETLAAGAGGGVSKVELRLPADLTFASNPDAPAPVLFRHETHVDASAPRCTGCHPEPFSILKRERRVSHAEMDEGRQCGICHDGRAAFKASDSDACEFCHSGEGGAP